MARAFHVEVCLDRGHARVADDVGLVCLVAMRLEPIRLTEDGQLREQHVHCLGFRAFGLHVAGDSPNNGQLQKQQCAAVERTVLERLLFGTCMPF